MRVTILAPISTLINPPGWADENTSMIFSFTKIASRLVNSVAPSSGT